MGAVEENISCKKELPMKNEQGVQNGSKTKRRFRYLFRRDSKPQQKAVVVLNEGNEEMLPPVEMMTPAEVDKEIKVRVESLQRRGLLACTESETKQPQNTVTLPPASSGTVSKLPSISRTKERPAFKPKYFVKRRANGA